MYAPSKSIQCSKRKDEEKDVVAINDRRNNSQLTLPSLSRVATVNRSNNSSARRAAVGHQEDTSYASNAKKQLSSTVIYLLMTLVFSVGVFFSGWEVSSVSSLHEDISVYSKTPQQKDEEHVHKTGDNHPLPPLAWLMSFPNSGTSYTMSMIKTVTALNPASNYGKESHGEDGLGVSLFTANETSSSSAGPPFWVSPTNTSLSHPSKGYILTKTHCGSRCTNCSMSKYLESHDMFLQHCLEGRYKVKDDGGQLIDKVGSYNKELVKRAVHLIRDPFDNVVSRFHLHYKHFVQRNQTDQLNLYPRSREGFRKFCSYEGERYYSEEKQSWAYRAVFDTVKDVPCHADFYRYIQWHNLAFITTWNLDIPSLVIHYENYTNNFQKTQDIIRLDIVFRSL